MVHFIQKSQKYKFYFISKVNLDVREWLGYIKNKEKCNYAELNEIKNVVRLRNKN